ncbi:hypothetical protein D9757_002418 [Collybiopsis confluens]|uniref:Uncharacterized protein n=1 Tax=Collybiopsis confluens TaxID=2823264 RepID=A0A8H5MF68_9AGAR|nr:hypothetical protein D9757_002418 [Collybiopsis confluens]
MHPHQNTSRRHSTPAIPYTSSPSPAAYAQTLISRQNISYPSSYPPHSAFPSSRPDLRDEISGSQREIVSGHSRSEWPGSPRRVPRKPRLEVKVDDETAAITTDEWFGGGVTARGADIPH